MDEVGRAEFDMSEVDMADVDMVAIHLAGLATTSFKMPQPWGAPYCRHVRILESSRGSLFCISNGHHESIMSP